MAQVSGIPLRRQFAHWVDAYEAAVAASVDCAIDEFLPPRNDDAYLPVLIELLRICIERSWRSGECVSLDDLLRRFPEVSASQAALSSVAFEEYRQRLLRGEMVGAIKYAERYGIEVEGWPTSHAGQVTSPSSIVAELDTPAESIIGKRFRTNHGADVPIDVGQIIAGFELVAELGRGAFARVFLAKQSELAGRYVVIKISERCPGESQTLAQLQHTNIVPVYSQHRIGKRHALCMPFFGGTTLADVLREFRTAGGLPTSGEGLVSTIKNSTSPTRDPFAGAADATAVAARAANPTERPSRRFGHWQVLEQYTYIETVLWLFARLADGLEHAHQHGVLHRDLKPANVLLRDDGEPMLLDFNLAGRSAAAADESTAVLGGTLPYMAPEQIRALRGEVVQVEASADLFSLGVMLYEMLTGESPFTAHGDAADSALVRELATRDAVPPPLSETIPHIAPAVQAIVSKCLAHDTAERYASAADLAEDMRRHLNHRPLRHAANTSMRERIRKWCRRHPRATSATAVAGIAAVAIALVSALWWSAEQRVARNDARNALDSFVEKNLDAQFLLTTLDPSSTDRQRGREQALRLLAYDDALHMERDGETITISAGLLNEDDRRRYDAELADLRNAFDATDSLPEAPDEVSPMSDREKNVAVSLRNSAADYFRDARLEYEKGHFAAAVELLAGAIERQPRQIRYWLLRGRAEEAQTHYDEAVACYTACIVLEPAWVPAYVQRGAARYQRRQFVAAAVDFDKAISLNSASTAALVNRALTRQQLGELHEAIADLDRAIVLEPDRTRLYYLRARLHRRAGHENLAVRDEQFATSRNPQDAEGWLARGVFLLPERPHDSLAAFETALQRYPRSLEALRNEAHVLSEHLHRSQQAIDVLSWAIKLYPDCAPAVLGRGVLYARDGRRDAALADARRGLKLDSGAEAHYQAACIYSQTSRAHPGDSNEAITMLFAATHLGFDRGIARRDPDLVPIRSHRDFPRIIALPPATAKAK